MNSKGMMWLVVLILIVGGGAGAWYYWGGQSNDADGDGDGTTATEMHDMLNSGATSTTDTSAAAGAGAADANAGVEVAPGPVKEITISGSNFAFAPKTISVKQGDTVKLTFKNSGGTHNLVIDELGVRTKTIQGGASDTVTFVASKAGSFQYYCSIGSHRAMGMWGTITVTN